MMLHSHVIENNTYLEIKEPFIFGTSFVGWAMETALNVFRLPGIAPNINFLGNSNLINLFALGGTVAECLPLKCRVGWFDFLILSGKMLE